MTQYKDDVAKQKAKLKAEEDNDLRYQVKFWQELYLKAISQQGKKDED